MTILKIVKYLTYIYISHVLVVERNYILTNVQQILYI